MKHGAAEPRWAAPGGVLSRARMSYTHAPCVLARNRPSHLGDEASS
jgi:hypothetical protein